MTLNRACCDEQHLCDLTVGEVLAGELGDPALAGRQRVEPCEHDPARARTGGSQLGLGVVGERSCARAARGVQCLAKELSRFCASITPPKLGAEVSEGASPFQLGIAALERVDGFTEQKLSTLASGHEASGALCDA
jgi:hypothetical protein